MDDVTLRPIQESDLDALLRFATDPSAGGEFEWTGFEDTRAIRKRWEEDGWIKPENTWLAVSRGDGTFGGVVSWRDQSYKNTKGSCFEVGCALLPEHRGQGVGTTAQLLMVDYLFQNTAAHRLQALTETDNLAEQRALEKCGFQREGLLRGRHFRAGEWRDSVLYARLRA
jgi:ribosomal-protein-alanine N-acetyltransferase